MGPIVVLGLGNILLLDDGVGVHAVRRLIAEGLQECVPIEIGTAALDALDAIEGAGCVIALDAVKSGHPPGTVVRYVLDDREITTPPPSLHDLGLAGVLRLLPAASRAPVVVLGVEPDRIEIGIGLSDRVAASLPRLLDATRAEVRRVNRDRASAARRELAGTAPRDLTDPPDHRIDQSSRARLEAARKAAPSLLHRAAACSDSRFP